ncbi:B3 domain-containing protein Os01g0905400-like isoform X12 [Telopea speciosissima]|uniref:B3 domain-containing protein Os01g0905400-like isoform X12 n=1 Tax=Telopea speciosissima TaxID=54955 RepID=UPI001CC67919|nr:B3 domain-containing protein Os01g0905400-like isoform X12 [Telopea speciosissima]
MGYKNDVCTECTKKCLLIHGKRESSPTVTSFFKVLVGDGFSEVLFIPPKFARTVSSMLGRKTYLEDSSGQRWSVKVSTIDGSLAFRQGWDEFASDHFLENGQFLVFTYIIGSHFVVQIYDKSGCEKLNFSQKLTSGGKKAKPKLCSDHLPSDGRKPVPMEAHFPMVDRGYMNEQGSSSTVPSSSNIEIIDSDDKDAEKTVMAAKCNSLCDISRERPKSDATVDCTEVPFYIIDRDFTTEQDETRTALFDLSNFEILRDQSGANRMENVSVAVGKETSSYRQGDPEKPQASVGEGTVHKDPVAVNESCGQASFDVSDLEVTEMECSAEVIDKVPSKFKKDSCCHHASLRPQIPSSGQPDEKKSGNPDMSKIVFGQYPLATRRNINDLGTKSVVKIKMEETPLIGSSGSVPQIITKVPGCFGAPVALKGEKGKGLKVVKKEDGGMMKEANVCLTGKISKTSKEESGEKFSHGSKDKGSTYISVKTEPMDSDDFSSSDLIDFCDSVTAVTQSWLELPTVSVSWKGKLRMDRKLVLLRDPAMKVWAVLYHERPGFRVLTSGWEAFAKANNIQPGDTCIFGVESRSEGLFRVNIVRRSLHL